MATTVGFWTLRLMRSDGDEFAGLADSIEVHDIFRDELSIVEEQLSNSVPEGYYVKIDSGS